MMLITRVSERLAWSTKASRLGGLLLSRHSSCVWSSRCSACQKAYLSLRTVLLDKIRDGLKAAQLLFAGIHAKLSGCICHAPSCCGIGVRADLEASDVLPKEHGLTQRASLLLRVTGHSLGGALAMLQLSSSSTRLVLDKTIRGNCQLQLQRVSGQGALGCLVTEVCLRFCAQLRLGSLAPGHDWTGEQRKQIERSTG